MPPAVCGLGAAILFLTVALVTVIWISMAPQRYRAVDGDTIQDLATTPPTNIRIEGIDAPELKAKDPRERLAGEAARRRLQAIIQSGSIKVNPSKRKEKFGRTLAKIEISGQDVGDILVREGHARPYSGGKRQPWF